MKLNLGCGNDKKPGWLNCDIDKTLNPDRVLDLRKVLPFATGSIEEVYCSHVLEHLHSDTLMDTTLPEIARVCKQGAKITVDVPFLDAQPTLDHKTRFTDETFNNWELFFGLIPVNRKLNVHWFHRPLFWIPLRSWKMWFSHLIASVTVELRRSDGEK